MALESFAVSCAGDGLPGGFGAGAHLIGLVTTGSPRLRAGEWTAGAERTQGDSQAAPAALQAQGRSGSDHSGGVSSMTFSFDGADHCPETPSIYLTGLQMDSLVISRFLLFETVLQ